MHCAGVIYPGESKTPDQHRCTQSLVPWRSPCRFDKKRVTQESDRASSLYIVETGNRCVAFGKALRERLNRITWLFVVADAVGISLLLNWEAI